MTLPQVWGGNVACICRIKRGLFECVSRGDASFRFHFVTETLMQREIGSAIAVINGDSLPEQLN